LKRIAANIGIALCIMPLAAIGGLYVGYRLARWAWEVERTSAIPGDEMPGEVLYVYTNRNNAQAHKPISRDLHDL